jgi:hypothetical protein
LNSSHTSQIRPFSRRLGGRSPAVLITLGVLQAAAPVSGFSPQAESVLETLRSRIAAGGAGEEAYGAFLDLLAEGDEEGCEAWWDRPELASASGTGSDGMRFGEIRSALSEVCPEQVAEKSAERDAETGGKRSAKKARAALSVAQAVQPRRDRSQAPDLQGAGSWSHGAWKASLQDYRPHQRYLRLGSDRFALHAGHIQPALTRTRLGFVAGGRFYTDRTGTSGAEGALFSPQRALDGLGVSAAAGGWKIEAAGAWNRLTTRGGDGKTENGIPVDPGRRDALAYLVGIAREKSGARVSAKRADGHADQGAPDFRYQAAHLRSEPGSETPAALSLAGARLAGVLPGWVQGWLGAAASLPFATTAAAAPGEAPAYLPVGAYLETGLASPPAPDSPRGAGSEWRLEARQASAEWANPLQSPRGILRDTLAGEWIIRGGGEGGLSSRAGFPLACAGPWSAGLLGRMGAGWSLEHGMLAQSGSLGVSQAWEWDRDRWSLETGASLGWYRRGLPGTAAAITAQGGVLDGTEAGGTGGLGQSLGWSRGPWTAKASFTWKGGDYSGSRPAPLTLEWSRREGGADGERSGSWSARLYTGDIRNPGSYLRAEARQTWKAGGRLKVEQEIRLPWTREGLAADMGYQLRLETAL